MKLKLVHRGLILVCVPLLFELVIVITLLVQTTQLETEIGNQRQVKKFMDTVTEIAEQILKAEGSVVATQREPTAENLEFLDTARKKLPPLLDETRKLAAGRKFQTEANKLINELTEHKKVYLDGCREIALQRVLMRQTDLPPEYFNQLDMTWHTLMGEYMMKNGDFGIKFSEEARGVQADLKDIQRASPATQQKIREQEKLFLLIALLASVVLALQLAFFFATGIVRRLLTITDNTIRLHEGRELNARVAGNDEIAHLDGVFHEMTVALREAREKERQMLEKLMIAEARVRSIIENTPVGVILLDPSGKIESINPRIEQLFHSDAEQLVEKHIRTLFENSDTESQFLEGLLNATAGKPVEKTAITADGSTFAASLMLNEIVNFEGKRYLINVQDVTERHELEKLKQEFYAMIAHDLRTPLMSAQMSLSVINEGHLGEVSPKVHTTLERAENGIKRLTNLINDFLDFEKLQAGKFDLMLKPMYLSSLLERSASEVRGLADKYGLKIQLPDEEAVTVADEERLIQVLINLLSNAIKFSPENETIIIEASNTGKELQVTVVDRGPGIPEDLRNNLFKSFSMLKNKPGTATRIKGTGLGLAICKMIIEQHGGTIGVDSKVGEGSRFWFKLPIRAS